MYGMADPTGGSYGNEDFSIIEEYMHYEASLKNRSVVFYGETSYWVNVDIDVPLFLPLYGQRRLHDLRRIAFKERQSGNRIDGQMNFDSGWEWGYWISNLVTARASWNPLTRESYEKIKESTNTTNTTNTCIQSPCSSVSFGFREDNTDHDHVDNADDWTAFRVSLLPVSKVFTESDEMEEIGGELIELVNMYKYIICIFLISSLTLF